MHTMNATLRPAPRDLGLLMPYDRTEHRQSARLVPHETIASLNDAAFQWRDAAGLSRSRAMSLRLRRTEVFNVRGLGVDGTRAFMSLLCGRLPPCAGQYLLLGQDLSLLGAAERRRLLLREVGISLRPDGLFSHLAVIDNIALPLLVNGVAHGAALERAGIEITSLGLERHAALLPHMLGTAEIRLARLGQALVHRPSLVVVEGPDLELDVQTVARIRKRLLRYCEEDHGCAVISTEHRDLLSLVSATLWLKESLQPSMNNDGART